MRSMLVEAMWMVANVAGDCAARGKGGGDVRAGLPWLRGRAIAKVQDEIEMGGHSGAITRQDKPRKKPKFEINRSF